MWQLYADQGRGIAIRTTVGKLRGVQWGIPPELAGKLGRNRLSELMLRKVKYFATADKGKVAPSEHLAFLKRDQFEDEREIRLLGLTSLPVLTAGFTLTCNLAEFIEEIVAGSHADLDATVSEINKRAFNLHEVPVRRSDIGPT